MGLTEAEIRYLQVLYNPVAWAESTLRDPRPGHSDEFIKLRYYQKEILLDPAGQKVIRAGRRLGKTATMVVNMLHVAITQPETIQIFATPYDTQAKLIYDELNKYIQASPDIKDSLARSTKSPYEFQFKNGSLIKGFTAGTRSGAEGGSLRGQAAQFLYLDELDYMTEADFETIYSIALADPGNIKVWCSSTPTGKRSTFWKLCTGVIPGWKEFYYPISCNPNWSPEMEAQLKAQYSAQGYIHECLAEFGEETVGVFNKTDIDAAKRNYQYGVHERSYPSPCFITVDWDKYGAETTILVTEFTDKFGGAHKLQVLNKKLIPKSEFTFDNAINEIVKLDDIYHADWIYVDRGAGEYQVETLRKYGLDHPETGFAHKVVGVSLGAARDVIDPVTGEKNRKPIKPFMVNQLSILFERGNVIINENDEGIIKQLEGYRVVKTSRDGNPIFSEENEHAVDCLGFAVLAITDKYPNLIKTISPYNAQNTIRFKPPSKQSRMLNPDNDYMDETDVLHEKTPLIKVPVGTKSYGSRRKIGTWGRREDGLSSQTFRKIW